MELISHTSEWKNLIKHYDNISKIQMRDLFEADHNRFNKFSVKFRDILFDYSKNIITEDTFPLLISLAKKAELKQKIDDMFAGVKINTTENRAVFHTALRNLSSKEMKIDGIDVMPQINEVKNHIKNFVNDVHSGKLKGAAGKKFTDAVNIGIGGSDLGPAMMCKALKHYAVPDLNIHFVSNVDSNDIIEKLKGLNPDTTLFIIASKTFTTQETLANANTAKDWFLSKGMKSEKDIAYHFAALSTNESACKAFGINTDNMFYFWDWVGGRYSLWSAIGLSIALQIGYSNFEQMLAGANDIDAHFKETPFERNIPVIMGLLGVWYTNFFGSHSHAVIPYDNYLSRFPAFLQQLDMESNGKTITKTGKRVDYHTGPIIWGEAGTNAQHSFFQLMHQGSRLIPADFISFIHSLNPSGKHQEILLSNFLAQTEALMRGKNKKEAFEELSVQLEDKAKIEMLLPHKIFEGNRPTNTFLIKKLTPWSMGALTAAYEHKVFTQGVIWGINSFDQWGVELGKQLAGKILPEFETDEKTFSHDASTNALINIIKAERLNTV